MSTSVISPPGTYYTINCYSDSTCSTFVNEHIQHRLVHFSPGSRPGLKPPVCYDIPATCTYVNVHEHLPRHPSKSSYLYYYAAKECNANQPIDSGVTFERSQGTGCVPVSRAALSLFVNQEQVSVQK